MSAGRYALPPEGQLEFYKPLTVKPDSRIVGYLCKECGHLAENPHKKDCPHYVHKLVEDQIAPVPNDSRPIWELVIEDMRERDRNGRAKYGTPLQANNGRDALVDAYQEALDLAVYLRQAIEERLSAPAGGDR